MSKCIQCIHTGGKNDTAMVHACFKVRVARSAYREMPLEQIVLTKRKQITVRLATLIARSKNLHLTVVRSSRRSTHEALRPLASGVLHLRQANETDNNEEMGNCGLCNVSLPGDLILKPDMFSERRTSSDCNCTRQAK